MMSLATPFGRSVSVSLRIHVVPVSVLSSVGSFRRWKSALPGRLGDPDMLLLNEPRMNQTMLDHLKKDLLMGKWGTVGEPVPIPFGDTSPLFLQHMWTDFMERRLIPKLTKPQDPGDLSSIEETIEIINGEDGNEITLYIAKPKESSSGRVPGLLHTHGGGMTFLSANDSIYRAYRVRLARRGFAVVSVEFRNASGLLGRHPYPAGLTDCMSGLAWMHSNREKLGISKLVLTGESGGGNLCSSMAIRAKREGRLSEFDGVFAMCPFIAGPEVWKEQSLSSLKECDKYFIDMAGFKMCGRLYDPDIKHVDDACCWPLAANKSDLEGLPPHLISVNELDPLRDEGLAYCTKLKDAGVIADSRIVEGTPHGGDMMAASIPGCEHIFEDLLDCKMKFAESL
eukprot:TRINITY_DN44192_c0_g1_i1.p1 TRINITY_DN44192_c0_g1~~TRINITY_DN44192_c0_g1_i1.p1  ORF type:complete len:397 (+),score=57.18 TRINITY_DN44192_c0_g1_i1:36-1226(+)